MGSARIFPSTAMALPVPGLGQLGGRRAAPPQSSDGKTETVSARPVLESQGDGESVLSRHFYSLHTGRKRHCRPGWLMHGSPSEEEEAGPV